MKFNYYINLLVIILLFNSCSSDSMPDCIQSAGKMVFYEAPAEDFTAIHVSEGIEVIVTQGDIQKVTVETGQNLRKNISLNVKDSQLMLENSSSCNWVRDYNITKVHITTPHLEKIYSASQFAVRSKGVLAFPTLVLQSGMFSETASGAFEMELDCENLTVEDNQAVYCKMSGRIDKLVINFYSGDARFDGRNLTAQKVQFFHRSSNDIILNVQQEVRGTLYSTGNLVLKNQPPIVEVERLYSGRVIYE